ncbi:hypothetical protein TrVGV298_009995 [Trichoderma virens]|nr:hypothetical protein TrVGV298_009995 [Trichoderma virens]
MARSVVCVLFKLWRPVRPPFTWLRNYPQAIEHGENVALLLWRRPAVRRSRGRILRDNSGRVLSEPTASRLDSNLHANNTRQPAFSNSGEKTGLVVEMSELAGVGRGGEPSMDVHWPEASPGILEMLGLESMLARNPGSLALSWLQSTRRMGR